MKTRMTSARCCCGAGGGFVCDPITGYVDDFETLGLYDGALGPGGWNTISNGLNGYSMQIQPVGTLEIARNGLLQEPGPFDLSRCAVYSTSFSNIRHRLTYAWEAPIYTGFSVSELIGLRVHMSSEYNTVDDQYRALQHDLEYVSGTGWRHRFTLINQGVETTYYSGPIIQAAQYPNPAGPFEIQIQMLMFRLLSGAWRLQPFSGNTSLGFVTTQPLAGDAQIPWYHGFGTTGYDTVAARINRFEYFAST